MPNEFQEAKAAENQIADSPKGGAKAAENQVADSPMEAGATQTMSHTTPVYVMRVA